jgi:hypothetical protein
MREDSQSRMQWLIPLNDWSEFFPIDFHACFFAWDWAYIHESIELEKTFCLWQLERRDEMGMTWLFALSWKMHVFCRISRRFFLEGKRISIFLLMQRIDRKQSYSKNCGFEGFKELCNNIFFNVNTSFYIPLFISSAQWSFPCLSLCKSWKITRRRRTNSFNWKTNDEWENYENNETSSCKEGMLFMNCEESGMKVFWKYKQTRDIIISIMSFTTHALSRVHFIRTYNLK